MNLLFYAALILQIVIHTQCIKNNVCPVFKDYYTLKDNPNCWYDSAANLNAVEIIMQNGFPAEVYKVTTPDGYILTVFRIPNRLGVSSKKGPVFLQHGWLNSAGIFVAKGKESLALILAKQGYDVWLGNFRGTEYSEEHVNLTVYDKKYWDYSADEIGLYDIPVQLELVANITGQRGNIVYIGHSLGTTSALMYGSSYPELAKETVKIFILLAPAANLANMKSLFFRILGPVFSIVLRIIDRHDLMRLVSQTAPLRQFAQQLCLESPVLMQRCVQIINLLVNGPRTQMEPHMIPVYFNHVPAGTSLKVARHIADSSRNNFRRYNYGFGNYRKYGTLFPPKYNVATITVPTFLMYAVNDWACTKEDSLNLYNNLSPNVKMYGLHEIAEPNFNHLDFFFGKNADTLVYGHVLRLIDKVFTKKKYVKYTNVDFTHLEEENDEKAKA